jgi:hypothetical protein
MTLVHTRPSRSGAKQVWIRQWCLCVVHHPRLNCSMTVLHETTILIRTAVTRLQILNNYHNRRQFHFCICLLFFGSRPEMNNLGLTLRLTTDLALPFDVRCKKVGSHLKYFHFYFEPMHPDLSMESVLSQNGTIRTSNRVRFFKTVAGSVASSRFWRIKHDNFDAIEDPKSTEDLEAQRGWLHFVWKGA